MTRRALNLGCGKVIFPADEQRAIDPDCEWVNVDRAKIPGVDLHFDLFAYPWPLETEGYDHVHLSHVAEHIPHQPRLSPYVLLAPGGQVPDSTVGAYLNDEWQDHIDRLAELDGFFAFFAECYRVLKPGGTIYVEVPHGGSDGALQDPTHTRYIVPSTVSYLTVQPSPTFDYELPFAFTCEGIQFGVAPQFQHLPQDQIGTLAHHQRNVIHTFAFTLRKIPLPEPAA